MTPWLVLVNPYASRGRRAKDRSEAALRERGIPAAVVEVDGLGALREAVDRAAGQGKRRFVAVGGDGTVNVVVNTLLRHRWVRPPVLGVLPAGGGCDLLRTFGIPDRIGPAADRLAAGHSYPVDVGLAIGEWGRRFFVNVASVGVTAAAATNASRLPGRWGSFRYVAAAVGALPGFRRCRIRVEAGHRLFEGSALAVICANGQFFGGGFNIAPRASMVDQLLDVQVIAARKREAGRLVTKARRGGHLTDPAVRRYTASEVRIETAHPWPVELDGEPVGTTPVILRTLSGRIVLNV